MAKIILFYLVSVLLIITVVARNCSRIITNCDDCFRCGGTWCYDKPIPECKIGNEDNICSANRENTTNIPQWPEARMVSVLKKNKRDFKFGKTEECEANLEISSTTQTRHISFETDDIRDDGKTCVFTIDVTPGSEFCLDNSTVSEQVSLKVSYGAESREAKYEVPCACACSQHRQVKAIECSGRGDYVCGICNCHKGWEGKQCEQEICPRNRERGDIPQFRCIKDEDCNGNGDCHCGQCRCFPHLEGYFDPHCRDICTVTREMDKCFININQDEPCDGIQYQPANETEVDRTDVNGSRIWIKCNISIDGCVVQYGATRLQYDLQYYTVMILKDCDLVIAGATAGVTVTVPAILGALALIAAAASVAGYMLWKNRSPPLPLSDPQYQNIGADFSQGENPLYKCPTSSFKNPTYGKC